MIFKKKNKIFFNKYKLSQPMTDQNKMKYFLLMFKIFEMLQIA